MQHFQPVTNDLDDHNTQGKEHDSEQPWHDVTVVAFGEQERQRKRGSEDERDAGAEQVRCQVEQAQARSWHTVYIHGSLWFGKARVECLTEPPPRLPVIGGRSEHARS